MIIKCLTDAGFTRIMLDLKKKASAVRLIMEHQVVWSRKRSIDQLCKGLRSVHSVNMANLTCFPIKLNIENEDLINQLEFDTRSLTATCARSWLTQFILGIGEG